MVGKKMSYAGFYKQTYKPVLFKKMGNFLVWNMDVGFRQWGHDVLIFIGPSDVDLGVLHDQINLNCEIANFW